MKLAILTAGLVLLVPTIARADDALAELPPSAPEVQAQPRLVESHTVATVDAPVARAPAQDALPLLHIDAGLRVNAISTRGFDTFASNDALPEFTLSATAMLLRDRRVSFGVGLGWGIAARGDEARGIDSSLTVQRFSIPLEGRAHLTSWLDAFARVAPAVAFISTNVHDASSPASLSGSSRAFATDLSVGVSLGPKTQGRAHFWFSPEIGYAVASATSIGGTPSRSGDDAIGSDGAAELHRLALSGAFFRAAAGMSF